MGFGAAIRCSCAVILRVSGNIDMKGGLPTFAAQVTNGSNAQGAPFANSGSPVAVQRRSRPNAGIRHATEMLRGGGAFRPFGVPTLADMQAGALRNM